MFLCIPFSSSPFGLHKLAFILTHSASADIVILGNNWLWAEILIIFTPEVLKFPLLCLLQKVLMGFPPCSKFSGNPHNKQHATWKGVIDKLRRAGIHQFSILREKFLVRIFVHLF